MKVFKLQKIIQEEFTKLLQEGWWDRYKRPYRDIANTIYDLVAPPDVPTGGYVPHEQEIDQNKVKELMKHGAQPWEHAEKLEDAAEQANAAAAATALLTLGLAARSGQAPAKPASTHTPVTFSGRPGPGQQTLIEPVPESWLQRMLSLDEGLNKIIQEELEGVLSGEDVAVTHHLASGEPVEKAQRRYKMGGAPFEHPELAPMSLEHGVDAIRDELGRETGPAYEDWRVAYEDPYHPEHEEAVLATPAMDPQRHMYPEKWKAMTTAVDPQIVQEELTKMLSERTPTADWRRALQFGQKKEKPSPSQVVVPAPRDKYGRRRRALGYTPPLREPKTKYDKEYHKYAAMGIHPSKVGLESSTEERIIIDDETGTAGVESGGSDIATPGTPSADPHWLKGRPPIESWGRSRHATADEIARGHGVDYGEREKRKWAFHGEQANYDPDWQGGGEMMSYPEASGEIGQTDIGPGDKWRQIKSKYFPKKPAAKKPTVKKRGSAKWEKGKSHEVT